MKKKLSFLMLTLVALVASMSLNSCDKVTEEVFGVENYYLVLSSVDTNLVDANGQSLENTLREAWITAFNANSDGRFSIGKTTEDKAKTAYYESIQNIKSVYDEAYKGKNLLPEGGYFTLNLALIDNSGSRILSSSVRVTNSGAN